MEEKSYDIFLAELQGLHDLLRDVVKSGSSPTSASGFMEPDLIEHRKVVHALANQIRWLCEKHGLADFDWGVEFGDPLEQTYELRGGPDSWAEVVRIYTYTKLAPLTIH